MNNKTLVINGHRNPNDSVFGQQLFNSVKNLQGVSTHTLADEYPDFKIDGPKERALLEAHENIVIQFPLYWYSSPAIVKEWLDEVLARGWAYGGGQALKDKKLLIATTTGGPEHVYQHEGANRFTMDEFLRPFEQTAQLCAMRWQKPFVMFGVRYLDGKAISEHAEIYRQIISEL
jgi:glutathione-regulated potassium-efflux system ancillary protein KefG